MKKIKLLLFVLLAFIACNEAPPPNDPVTAEPIIEDTPVVAADTSEMRIQIPDATCYRYATKKDTILLKVEKFPNVVTGMLSYRLHEKDQNNGEIDGVMKGDTILAEYTFMSEGVMSRRQVTFLIKDDIATEGYGEMEEKDGKMVFKENATIDFKKGTKLKKVACEN